MSRYILFLFFSISVSPFFGQIPTQDLQLWLKADQVVETGGKVQQWIDLSPNNYPIVQNTPANQPQKVDNVLNGRPVIRFNGSSTYLDGGDILDLGTNSHTIFFVGLRNSANGSFLSKSVASAASGRYAFLVENNTFYYLYHDNAQRFITTPLIQTGTFYLIRAENNRNESKNKLLLNEQLIGESSIIGAYDFNTSYNFLIGAYNNSSGGVPPFSTLYLNGDIAEIIVYNRVLNSAEMEQVNLYLDSKYSPAFTLGNDTVIPYGFSYLLQAPSGFTNVQWSTGATGQSIIVNQSGEYLVSAVSPFGITRRDTIHISFPSPQIAFSSSNLCFDSIYEFHAGQFRSGNYYTLQWFNGYVGDTLRISNYQGPIWAKVIDSAGYFRYTDTLYVALDNFVNRFSLGPDTTLCSGATFSIVDNPFFSELTQWVWSSGSTQTAITITVPDDYSITVTNINGCVAVDTVNIDVQGIAPVADFIVNGHCQNAPLTFVNQSVSFSGDSIVSVVWNFGDGTVSTETNPVHTYITPGTYTVRLVIFTESGCSNQKEEVVTVYPQPSAYFMADSACVSAPYYFYNQSQSSVGTHLVSFLWSFGNGDYSSDQNPVYQFPHTGTYNVTLTVTDNRGCSHSFSRPVVVDSWLPPASTVTLVSPVDGLPSDNQTITFRWNPSRGALFYRLQIANNSSFNTLVHNIFTNKHQETVNLPAGTYFWRVVAYNACHQPTYSENRKVLTGFYDQLSGLQLRFSAFEGLDTIDHKVVAWQNLANPSQYATQSNALYQPVIVPEALNGKPSVLFGTENASYLGFDTVTIANNQFSVVVVYKPTAFDLPVHYIASGGTATTSQGGIFAGGSLIPGLGLFDGQNTLRVKDNNSGWQIAVVRSNDIMVNTEHPELGSSTAVQKLKLNLLGSRTNALNGQYFKGYLAEFMVFNRRLSDEETINLTHYLRYKFFPPLSLGNDTTLVCGSCNHTLEAPSGYVSYQWSNGSTSSQTTVHQTGNYSLTVTDAFTLTSSDDIRVVCPSQSCYPGVNLGPDKFGTCGFCNFTLNATAAHFVAYQWSTGATTPTIVVNTTGFYSVTATDVDGYSSTDTIFVQCPTVSCDPAVDLGPDISVTYGFCPVILQAGSIYQQYLWSTGAITSSISVNNPGTYWVSVVDQYNFVSSDTVRVSYPKIQLSDTGFCAGQSVVLNPNLGNDYSYLWSTSAMNPSIEVNQAGTYWVYVTDTLGCSRQSANITVSVDSLPFVNWFSTTDTTLCRSSQLSVSNIPAYTYLWNTSETGSSITVENSGWYRLSVTSPFGCVAVDSVFVHLNGQAPIVIFGVDDGCTGSPLTVINETISIDTTPITRWEWRIDHQLVSTDQYPTLIIDEAGNYEISLTAGNENGCFSTQTKPVTIHTTPEVQPIIPDKGCAHVPIQFQVQTTPNDPYASYQWNIQNQYYFHEPEPVFIFDSAGIYTIWLTVTTSTQCSTTVETSIHIIAVDQDSLAITLTYPQPDATATSNKIPFRWNASNEMFSSFALQISDQASFNTILYEAQTTQTSLTVSLPMGEHFYWRVVGTTLCNTTHVSESRLLRRFTPANLGGLALWLSADSVATNGQKVARWYDLSPNQHVITQNNPANQPQKVDNVLNRRPVIHFNGTSTYLDGGDILDLGTNSHTIFLIGLRNSTNGSFLSKSLAGAVQGRYALLGENNNLYMIYHDNAERNIVTNQLQSGEFYLIRVENNREAAKNRLFLNQSLVGEIAIAQSYNFNTGYNFLIGAYNNSSGGIPPLGGYYLNGDIAEIIIYNRILTAEEQGNIEQYLLNKYSGPIDLGDDIYTQSFCPVTLQLPGVYSNVLWSTGSTEPSITVNQSGEYWVEGTNLFGITSRDTIRVTFPLLNLPDKVNFCLGTTRTVGPPITGPYTYLWSNGATTPTTTISTPGNFWVKVTDSLGCWKEQHFVAEVDSFALQTSLGDDGPICNGTRITLVEGGQNAVSYRWSDGSNLPYFTVNNNSQLSVTVTNINGCQAIDTINFWIIGDAPSLAFDHSALCKGNQLEFTDFSQSLDGSSIVSRRWIFNQTDTLYGSQVTYSYPDTGRIEIKLKVSTQSGCWQDTTFSRRVNDIPIVNFTPTTACERNSVQFTAMGTVSDGSITSYRWDFPGSTLTTASPVYSFSTAGEHPVSLTLTSNHGCSNSTTKTVEIKNSPIADFTWSTACEGIPVNFTNTTQSWLSTKSDYFWTFNQQFNLTQTHPQYTFPTAGAYEVRLVAIQRVNQCRDTIVKTVTVAPNPVSLPMPVSGCATDTIVLNHSSTPGTGYTISHIQWSAPLNAGIISENLLFGSNSAGIYPLELRVTNNAGCWASAQSTVQIFEKPVAQIVIPNDTLYLPASVIVASQHNKPEYFYRWYRNGILHSTDSTLRFIQNTPHIDTIVLEMTTPQGCSDTDQKVITTLVPEIDLEMISVSAIHFSNQLLIRVQMRNNGTVPIESTLLKVTPDVYSPISELCTESIGAGSTLSYTLRTRILTDDRGLPNYICVETETNGDNHFGNNRQCYIFDKQLKIYNPTPNPARDYIDVKIISPTSTLIEFSLINSLGSTLEETTYNVEEGLNNIRLFLPTSATGILFLKIRIDDNLHFYKILVNK